MRDYVIMTDSSCDLPWNLAKALDIEVLPLVVSMGRREYRDELEKRESVMKAFYADLRAGNRAFTSAVSQYDFRMAMERHMLEGRDVLMICFDSVLSGTYLNARIIASTLEAKYPERRIFCVDSRSASLGQGLLVYLAANARNAGGTLEEVRTLVEKTIPKVCHWFTVGNLCYLKHGGRLQATAAPAGKILHMMPVLHVDDEGRLASVGRARGRQAAMNVLLEKARTTSTNMEEQTVFISHGDCLDDALELRKCVMTHLHPREVVVGDVGPVIGAHSGPDTLAMFFLGDKR